MSNSKWATKTKIGSEITDVLIITVQIWVQANNQKGIHSTFEWLTTIFVLETFGKCLQDKIEE